MGELPGEGMEIFPTGGDDTGVGKDSGDEPDDAEERDMERWRWALVGEEMLMGSDGFILSTEVDMRAKRKVRKGFAPPLTLYIPYEARHT
jgi:hypothetical protein